MLRRVDFIRFFMSSVHAAAPPQLQGINVSLYTPASPRWPAPVCRLPDCLCFGWPVPS
jgi:hypothetical protein